MATLSTIAKLPRPELSDPPNAPSAFTNLTDTLDKMVIPRFASATARDTAIPSPVQGQHAFLDDGDILTVYSDNYGRWMQYTHGATGAKAFAFGETKALSSATQALTTSLVDVTNCSSTFTTVKAQALVKVDFSGDFDTTATSAGTGRLVAVVDGLVQASQVNFSGSNTTAGARGSCSNSVWVNLGAAGSHTVKLQTAITGTLGIRLNGPHTTLTVSVFE